MKTMITLCAMFLVLGTLGVAEAIYVDFESTGLSEGDALIREAPGLTFSGAIIGQPGSPLVGFDTDDLVEDTALDGQPFAGFFITDLPVGDVHEYVQSGTIEISFDNSVCSASFYVVDIDDWEELGGAEVLTVQAFNEFDILLQTVTITAGDPGTGDGIATFVDLNGERMSRITIRVANSADVSGWGIDNLSYEFDCAGWSLDDSAEASTVYGRQVARESSVLNVLALLLVPAGAVVFLRVLRRRQ